MAEDQGVDPVVQLAYELFSSPKTRARTEESIAELHPERAPFAVPGHMMRTEMAATRAEIQKDRDALAAERAADQKARENATLRATWLDGARKAGARDDELPHIEKLAKERLIGDPEAAVDMHRKQLALAEPTSGHFGVRIPGAKVGEFFKGLDENQDQWARQRAAQDIDIIKRHGVGALETLAPSPLR